MTPSAATAGRHLGRYELLEQLGEGGMGAVWLARLSGAAGFEKLCIVKTVLPSIAKDAEFVSRFLHEGRVLTQLSHGNIAQVLDMNEAEGQLYLALEYVAGVDLARLHEQVRAAQEYMPLQLVVALVVQAAEGLGAAHRKLALDGSPLHIVHRDVSPHNIMVSYEGEVKVIDFGIAKSEARSRHTAQASVMGKLGYMAPEQARGEPVDHRADQFALAIVAWELLSNLSWVKRGTLTEMVVAMANPPPARPLSPLRADVPASLEAVVLKALSPLPGDRFATTDEFAQMLMAELLKLGTPPTKPQLGEYVRSRCAADFSTQRQLLTRVSTQRSPPPEGPRADMFAETVVRTPGSTNVATAVHRGLGPAESATVPPTAAPTMANVAPRSLEPLPPPVPTTTDRPAVSPARPAEPRSEQAGLITPSLDTARDERSNATSPARSAVLPGAAEAERNATSPARPAVLGSSIDSTRDEGNLDPASGERPAGVKLDVPAVSPRSEPPLTTGELRAAAPRRSPVGLVLAVVGLLVIIAVLAYALRPQPRPPEVTTPPLAVIDAGVKPSTPEVVAANPTVEDGLDAGELEQPPPDAGVQVAEPVPAVETPTLPVKGRLSPQSWIIHNPGPRNWVRCRMTLPGQKVIEIGTVPRGSLELPLRRFRFDPNATPILNQARLDCAQGFGLIDLP